MAQVTIKINGYSYTVGCEDGQESHLLAMADQVEKRIESIKALGGQTGGEARLLVLASLLMADELHDLHIELGSMRNNPPPAPVGEAETDEAAKAAVAKAEAAAARRVSRLARRAEEIAANLERP